MIQFQALIKQVPHIIRVALHPRDPHQASKEQKDMINRLKHEGYDPPLYSEVIQKFQKLISI